MSPSGGPGWLRRRAHLRRPGRQPVSSGVTRGSGAQVRCGGMCARIRWFRLNSPHSPPAPTLDTKGACSPLWSRFTNVNPGVILEGGRALRDRRPAAPPVEAGAVKASDARLKPAPEAECHGALPKEVRGAQRGRRRVRKGRAVAKAHAGEAGPTWGTSRGSPPRRIQRAGEPPGSVMGDSDPQAKMRAMGQHPSHRIGRCLANGMLATEV